MEQQYLVRRYWSEASKPVMEGKGLLFKIFADIDVFDIEVDASDVDTFVQTVKAISPTFGGINLEDIKAPECFRMERRLKELISRLCTMTNTVLLLFCGCFVKYSRAC